MKIRKQAMEKVRKMTKSDAREARGTGFLPKESEEQQRLNRIGRKGKPAPKHGEWAMYKKV